MFNLRHLQAHTKTTEKQIRELLFADDAALVVHMESAMQPITSHFTETAQLFRLEVRLKETEVLHQPAHQEEYKSPSLFINETELKPVHQFSYLGCMISDVRTKKEVDNRLARANSTTGRLYKHIQNIRNLKKTPKSTFIKL